MHLFSFFGGPFPSQTIDNSAVKHGSICPRESNFVCQVFRQQSNQIVVTVTVQARGVLKLSVVIAAFGLFSDAEFEMKGYEDCVRTELFHSSRERLTAVGTGLKAVVNVGLVTSLHTAQN